MVLLYFNVCNGILDRNKKKVGTLLCYRYLKVTIGKVIEAVKYLEYKNEVQPVRADLPACPVQTCVQLIGTKWKLLIMRDLLMNGSMRFGALKKSVGGISQKVLTSNLREMEDAGLIARRVYPEVPPRVEYLLTDTGESLRPVINAMQKWGEWYQAGGIKAN